MKNIKFVAILGACFIASASPAFAQGQCAEILRNGTLKYSSFKDNSYYQQIIWSRFIKSTYESSRRNTDAGFTVPVGEIVLGANYSEAQYNVKKQQLQSEYFNQISSAREIDVALTSGDEEIIDAWSRCMDRSGGLSLRFEPVTATDVAMVLEYRNQGTRNRDRLAQNINLPAGVQVTNGAHCLRRNTWITAGKPCIATLKFQTAMQTALIAADAQESAAQAWLPARIQLAREVQPYPFTAAHRLQEYAHKRTASPRATVELTPEQIKDGWLFDPATAQTNLYVIKVNNQRNRCFDVVQNADAFRYTYGYTIYGGNRRRNDGDIHCAMNPSILMRRDVWVAASPVDTPDGGDGAMEYAPSYTRAEQLRSIFERP